MKKPTYHIDRLRHNLTLRGMIIFVFWISILFSIPQTNINGDVSSAQVQKFLPPISIPLTSPSTLLKSSTEYSEFSIIVLGTEDLEKHLHIYTLLELCSSDHAQTLASVFLYTQTTSSFL